MKTVTPEPTAEMAFRAGWVAAYRCMDHDWGPRPPQTPEHAWERWLEQRSRTDNAYVLSLPEEDR